MFERTVQPIPALKKSSVKLVRSKMRLAEHKDWKQRETTGLTRASSFSKTINWQGSKKREDYKVIQAFHLFFFPLYYLTVSPFISPSHVSINKRGILFVLTQLGLCSRRRDCVLRLLTLTGNGFSRLSIILNVLWNHWPKTTTIPTSFSSNHFDHCEGSVLMATKCCGVETFWHQPASCSSSETSSVCWFCEPVFLVLLLNIVSIAKPQCFTLWQPSTNVSHPFSSVLLYPIWDLLIRGACFLDQLLKQMTVIYKLHAMWIC